MKQKTIAILGAGSWGTAMAIHLAHSGHEVLLWGHHPHHIQDMISTGCNQRYLPDIPFPSSLTPSDDLQACISQADEVMIAVPSHAFASVLAALPKPKSGIAWLTKGIDPSSKHLLSQLVTARWGAHFPIAIISGPSFAKEVAQLLPTAIVIAGHDKAYLHTMQQLLHHDNLRVYLTEDVIGVQLCGAVKNVLAIACGISDGLHYGANAKAALITRGLAEMTRLGLAFGAQQDTFLGLAGVGDLVLTCTDDQSRNRRFGLQLGAGKSPEEAEKAIQQVVEGKHNAGQLRALANSVGVEMPICEMVFEILSGNISSKEAVTALMTRPPKHEV